MSDDVAPLPAEGTLSDSTGEQAWNALPQRNRRRKRRGAYPLWLKYAAWCVGLAAVLTATQLAVHTVRSDPRDARVFAERELRFSTLKPNEHVVAQVNVWQRPAIDYYRATRGLLVLTDAPGDSTHPIGGRVIYLGLQPRDPLSPGNAPPTFDERDWAVDTLVQLAPARTFFFLSRAVRISSSQEHLTVGVPSPAAGAADSLLHVLEGKHAALRRIGWQRRELRRERDRARLQSAHLGRMEWFHTVRRGEALASVARLYGTTPEQLRALNGIAGDKIKVGQTLKVKGLTKQAMPFPAGITPDSMPKR